LLNFISAAIKITLSAALPADNLLGKYALQTKGSAEGHARIEFFAFHCSYWDYPASRILACHGLRMKIDVAHAVW
jgi:hypothetical protein